MQKSRLLVIPTNESEIASHKNTSRTKQNLWPADAIVLTHLLDLKALKGLQSERIQGTRLYHRHKALSQPQCFTSFHQNHATASLYLPRRRMACFRSTTCNKSFILKNVQKEIERWHGRIFCFFVSFCMHQCDVDG